MSTKPTLQIQIELSLYLSSISLCLHLFNATQILPRNQTKEEVYDSQRYESIASLETSVVMFVNSQHFRNKILHLSVTNIKFCDLALYVWFNSLLFLIYLNCCICNIRMAFGLLRFNENITTDTCLIPPATQFWKCR